ncbi:MAG: hypothetical protein A2Y07_08980 [Planctomycetes bacterium GWF2_50_10]|nr:MAG: hypothetical protein A2Y07_08980 [Planctomycetes bacterium GWF2_50_10]
MSKNRIFKTKLWRPELLFWSFEFRISDLFRISCSVEKYYLALSGLILDWILTQGCASLHPGLSNLALSGLKTKCFLKSRISDLCFVFINCIYRFSGCVVI